MTEETDDEMFSSSFVASGNSRVGPHGLGDPDDKTLRKVELEVSIPGIIRDRAHREKCRSLIDDFGQCGEKHGFWAFLYCRKEVKQMNNCLSTWFVDKDFREECTKMYLDERSEYRRTGIHRKPIKRPYYINPEKEKERLEKLKKEYERLENKS